MCKGGLVFAVLEASHVMREGRVGVAVLPGGVVGGDGQRCFGQAEAAVDVAERVVAGGAARAVNRVRAWYWAGGRRARVAAGCTGQDGLVLVILEAADVVCEVR